MELITLLKELTERDGSDLHLVVGQPPVFRVHGELVRREGEGIDAETMTYLLQPALSDRDWDTVTLQSADIETTLRDADRSYRFHVFRERGRLAATVRPVPRTIPTLDELYGPHQEAIRDTLTKIAHLPRGLVIVTGPTGSGKTTTCYAMMEEINRTQARRIIVLEEHLSYDFDSKQSLVTQRNVGDDVASYEQGAYWAFHEDLDVIYIGEMRTPESVQYALALAETGHLVLITLHVQTVFEAISRLIDVFSGSREAMQRTLARALSAVIAQQLVPRGDRPGRIAVHEVLLMTPQVRQLIETGQTDFTAEIEANREAGMITMDEALRAACDAGLLTEDVIRSRLVQPLRV